MDIKNYIIEFKLEELKVINDALIQMPYFKAAPVIDTINKQLSRQDKNTMNSVSEFLSEEKQ